MEEVRGFILKDNLESLIQWRLDNPTLFQPWAKQIFISSVKEGSLRCIEWFLQNGADPNQLFYTQSDCDEYAVISLLIRYGANPTANCDVGTIPMTSQLFYFACSAPPKTGDPIAHLLFWAGARLTTGDKIYSVNNDYVRSRRCIVLDAENTMDERKARCRSVCILFLRFMPGPKDCTRDWIKRFLWPLKFKRVWQPEKELPEFLRGPDE